jgi:hypothetical protein
MHASINAGVAACMDRRNGRHAVNAIDFAWEFFALDRRECADDYAWVAHLRRSMEI